MSTIIDNSRDCLSMLESARGKIDDQILDIHIGQIKRLVNEYDDVLDIVKDRALISYRNHQVTRLEGGMDMMLNIVVRMMHTS